MTMLDALEMTTNNASVLARPVGWTRGGYYVANARVWDHNPLRLAADLKTVEPTLALFPSYAQLAGEWEVVPR